MPTTAGIMAVANKLLKQVFGLVKNECLFDRNYYKKKPDLLVFCTVRVGISMHNFTKQFGKYSFCFHQKT